MAKKSEKQAKDVKKLRKAVEKLGERNEKLEKSVEKLRKSQEKSREEFENILRDVESRIETLPDGDSDAASAVTIGADGAIVSKDERLGESADEPSEETSDAPVISAADEIEGDGEPMEESSDAPTVSADDEIEGDGEPIGVSSDAPMVSADDGIFSPRASVKATESAKRKAEELGVDLTGVEGTGSRDRITVGDVEKAAEKG
ncbi:MAG: E3 binding domain-containing protein [Actinomycetota bacterium]|jgi:pyruvate/2-oxoglutarate dehydrogenase complex dihydrolipoamide acyltransferase (E2) component|nr:E3 binding domain-containing protein [Actinomycetota bacterium]